MTDALTCPQCGAASRPDAAWCSLCYAQLAAGFDPLTAPLEEILGETRTTAVMTQQAPAPVVAPEAWLPEQLDPVGHLAQDVDASLTSQNTVGPLQSSDIDQPPMTDAPTQLSEVDVMLAMLASEHRQLDPSAEIVDRMGDKGARVLVIVGGTIVVAVVAFVLMAVVGLFA